MTDLAGRAELELRRHGVEQDAPIGVACSGGADSIALLHLLDARPDVHVLHVDHGLRADSPDDASFVRDSAQRLGRAFDARAVRVDPSSDSVEAAAREARYAALEDMAVAHGLVAVLTAHTRDDQAETVLLRLLRGDTLDAIAPVRGRFLRPLLGVTRADLRAFLVEHEIAWREDPSNLDTRFERNWIRNVVLPQLVLRRPGVSGVLARTADRARDDALALDAIASSIVAGAACDDVGLHVEEMTALPRALQTRVVRGACRRLGHDPSAGDVDAIVGMSSHVRTGGIDVWRLDDGLAFTSFPVRAPEPVRVPSDGLLESSAWGIALRADAGLVVRSRRPGDRVTTPAGTRKVQDVLVDAKVPRSLRDLVPIVSDVSGTPLAVVGGRLRCASVAGAEPYRQTWTRARVWASWRR